MGFAKGDDLKFILWKGHKYDSLEGTIHLKAGDIVEVEFTDRPWNEIEIAGKGFELMKGVKDAIIDRSSS